MDDYMEYTFHANLKGISLHAIQIFEWLNIKFKTAVTSILSELYRTVAVGTPYFFFKTLVVEIIKRVKIHSDRIFVAFKRRSARKKAFVISQGKIYCYLFAYIKAKGTMHLCPTELPLASRDTNMLTK
ncbi:hypothetical protein ACJX0J_029828 [Zea mays]